MQYLCQTVTQVLATICGVMKCSEVLDKNDSIMNGKLL